MARRRHSAIERRRLAYATSGLPLKQAAATAGVAPSTMQRWRNEAGVSLKGGASIKGETSSRKKQVQELLREDTATVRRPRRGSEIVGECLDRKQVRKLLRLSSRELAERRRKGDVLAIAGKTTDLFPVWQFDRDARAVRPAVKLVTSAFYRHLREIDTLLIATWAMSRKVEDLDGQTPAQWIASGNDNETVAEAASRTAVRLAW